MEYLLTLTTGHQKFTVFLGENEYTVTLVFRKSDDGGFWFLDFERKGGTASILGIPLVINTDLFEQFGYMGVGHLRCECESGEYPTYKDVGRTVRLIWSE